MAAAVAEAVAAPGSRLIHIRPRAGLPGRRVGRGGWHELPTERGRSMARIIMLVVAVALVVGGFLYMRAR